MFFGKQQRLRVREDMLLVVALLIISLTTYAQNTTTKTLSEVSLDSLKVYTMPGVTIYGRRSQIVPAQTLSGEQLKKLSVVSVADALRYFSGVQIKDYGGIGGLKTVNVNRKST